MGALKQAEIIPISKGRDKMTDKFEKGYVMSSRLYRSDVRPFLSDAARNVYAELEDRINGFKDKTTDFVSYSQLQGGKLEGSKKLSTTTVRKGLKELTDLGVVTVVSSDSRKGNEYRINEVSLVEHFKNCNTTLESKALQKVKREHFTNESASTLETKDTIELYKNIYREESTQENPVDEVLNIWKPDLQQLNSWMQRSGLPKISLHGHIEQNDWEEFKDSFGQPSKNRAPSDLAMWGRERLDTDNHQYTHVNGVDAVIMGHTVTQKPCKRDNCYWIDTGAVHWGTITILDLETI